MKGESSRVRMTKALLQNSLVDLMETQNIRQITIKSICEHADVNRSTFYLYYGSQYDLLKDIERKLVEDTKDILQAEHARRGTRPITTADLIHLLELHLTYIAENIRFFKAFSHNYEDFDLPLKTMHIILDPYVEQTAAKHQMSDREAHQMAVFMMFGCIGTVKDWIANYDEFHLPPSALAAMVAGHIECVSREAGPLKSEKGTAGK